MTSTIDYTFEYDELQALMMKAEEGDADIKRMDEALIEEVSAVTGNVSHYTKLNMYTNQKELSSFDNKDARYAFGHRVVFQYVVNSESGVYFVCTDFDEYWDDALKCILWGKDEQISRILVPCWDGEIRTLTEAAEYYSLKW